MIYPLKINVSFTYEIEAENRYQATEKAKDLFLKEHNIELTEGDILDEESEELLENEVKCICQCGNEHMTASDSQI